MRLLPLICCLVLTACTLALPGRDDKPVRPAANPITGGAITTSSLETVKPASAAISAAPTAAVPNPEAKPKPEPAKPEVTPAKTEAAVEKPNVSPQQLACIKKGGHWRSTGKSGGEACFNMTKDAGKSCKKESDCDGYCLARSRTCAPFKPMFGCNDILQDNGVMVTLCID